MAQLFSDQLQEAKTPGEFLRLWFRTVADLLRTVPVRYIERQGTFSPFHKQARLCIFFARYAAEGFGHPEITPEDLLLGVLREDRSIRSCLRPEALQEIRRALGGNPPRSRILRNKTVSAACRRILAAAREEIDRTGEKQILPRHLIAAIVSDGSTVAAQLLLRHGIDLDRLRSAE
jgi:ATP-dependent Clp protease ATP-binding subunit ClpA